VELDRHVCQRTIAEVLEQVGLLECERRLRGARALAKGNTAASVDEPGGVLGGSGPLAHLDKLSVFNRAPLRYVRLKEDELPQQVRAQAV
jgi:hypothetical protein